MKENIKSPKILICTTDDWFIISHFKPLISSLCTITDDVNVIARYKFHQQDIEKLQARPIPLNFKRRGFQAFRSLITTWRLIKLFYRERPDVVHLIAMKPIVLGGLAFCLSPAKFVVIHLTGVGLLGTSPSPVVRAIHNTVMYLTARLMSRKSAWLLIENPDDRKMLETFHAKIDERMTLLGGAGIDPDFYPAQPFHDITQTRPILTATFIGRMVWSKGVDVLVQAQDLLSQRGLRLKLNLCGDADPGNPTAIDEETLDRWKARLDCKCLGRIQASDVPAIWQASDIAVVPSRGGEGLPRSLLEAAASARPLIVTDVPGCRHFVRDGIEGFVIPPDNAEALCDALEKLIRDPDLRQRMGQAARQRVLDGFTEEDVKNKITETYREILRRIG